MFKCLKKILIVKVFFCFYFFLVFSLFYIYICSVFFFFVTTLFQFIYLLITYLLFFNLKFLVLFEKDFFFCFSSFFSIIFSFLKLFSQKEHTGWPNPRRSLMRFFQVSSSSHFFSITVGFGFGQLSALENLDLSSCCGLHELPPCIG